MFSTLFKAIILSSTICAITSFTTKLSTGYVSSYSRLTRTSSLIALPAKKKSSKNKKSSSSGQGFGKQQQSKNDNLSTIEEETTENNNDPTLLQSIEPQQSSPFLSVNAPAETTSSNQDTEESIASTEGRTKQILQDQYGLRTYEQRQDNMKAKDQEKKFQKLVKQAKKEEEDIDLFSLIPPPLIKIIDGFLKVGLGVSTLLFVAAGIGITLEAYSASSGNPLPENIDNYITNVIEPNFTIGLLVLLGFSVSLGVFSLGQLGSKGSVYRED